MQTHSGITSARERERERERESDGATVDERNRPYSMGYTIWEGGGGLE